MFQNLSFLQVISNEAVKAAKADVDASRDAYDILIAEDKVRTRSIEQFSLGHGFRAPYTF